MKRFVIKRFTSVLSLIGIFCITTQAFASAFQLFEQDGASVGNYHAGYAAIADDASTSFYNPAGMTRIKTQEAIFGGNAIVPSFKFVGNVRVNSFDAGNTPLTVTAQGGAFAFVPFLHYVAPINDNWAFGFSVDVPFGLKTYYGNNTFLRYVATLSSVVVVDVSPSLAYKINDKISLGAGFDIQRMFGEFDSTGTLALQLDTQALNKANDTAYGYHAGVLYEFNDNARIGLSYHSQVIHHLSGTSKFIGPLADVFNNGFPINTKRTTANFPLPPYTALSGYYRFNPCSAVMASVIYTRWTNFQHLILNDVAGLGLPGPEASTNIKVDVPANYRDSWNFALGGDLSVSPNVMLRAGVGYDQSPIKNAYRNVQLPDNNRYIIALGGHYQITENVGADLSWLHVFIRKATVHPATQVMGAQSVKSDGYVMGGADVLGGQIVWDMV